MTEKVHSVLRAQSQLQLLPELGQNLRPNLKLWIFLILPLMPAFDAFVDTARFVGTARAVLRDSCLSGIRA